MEWNPHPGPQTEALSRSEREILYGGARGGGKTEAGRAWLAEPEYIGNPRFRSLVIRKNFKDLSDWISKARVLYHGMAQITSTPAEIRWNAGGVTVMGHWADPSAISQYLGHEFQKMLIEEITDCLPTEVEYLKLLGSARSSVSELVPQVFCTTNPGGRGHAWVKKRWVDVALNKTYIDPETMQSRIFIPAKIEDNPTLCEADPAYLAYLDSLPPRLRAAWRDGSWDLAEGAFFSTFGRHMAEASFQIPERSCFRRLYGSLDIGITHATAFGLWYIAPDGICHRLMTYLQKLDSSRDHAHAIKQAIESFPYTHGHLPEEIFTSPDAWTKTRLNEQLWRAPIDEYEEEFAGKTRFVKANDARANGCQVMLEMYATRDGRPQSYYFEEFNRDYEDYIPAGMTNPNKPEEYIKTSDDGDDLRDEVRYGMVGAYTVLTGESRAKANRELAGSYNTEMAGKDWMDM